MVKMCLCALIVCIILIIVGIINMFDPRDKNQKIIGIVFLVLGLVLGAITVAGIMVINTLNSCCNEIQACGRMG